MKRRMQRIPRPHDMAVPSKAHARDRRLVCEHIGKFYSPKHVCEVAVFRPGYSYSSHWIGRARVTMVEPQPDAYQELVEKFGDEYAVSIHNVAIVHERGAVEIAFRDCENGAAYLVGVRSPIVHLHKNDNPYTERIPVEGVLMSDIDDGTIDYLICDTEGSEWATISKLVSRPSIIQVEMRGPGGYVNPSTTEILEWMRQNGYSQRRLPRVQDSFFLADGVSMKSSSHAPAQASVRLTSGRRASQSSRFPRRYERR